MGHPNDPLGGTPEKYIKTTLMKVNRCSGSCRTTGNIYHSCIPKQTRQKSVNIRTTNILGRDYSIFGHELIFWGRRLIGIIVTEILAQL